MLRERHRWWWYQSLPWKERWNILEATPQSQNLWPHCCLCKLLWWLQDKNTDLFWLKCDVQPILTGPTTYARHRIPWFLTKHCYNCIYLLSIAFILNGLILEAYAKASLNTKGWQFSSQFDQVFFCYLICLNLKWYANAYKNIFLIFLFLNTIYIYILYM